MAKRKRLSPARPGFLTAGEASGPASGPFAPPIAQVAGEAATAAALEEVAQVLVEAKAEGRLIEKLPLEAIITDYLMRDRLDAGLVPGGEEMDALMDSLRERGQQTPIEVVELGPGRFGLISGARRMAALRQLRAEPGGAGFDTVMALVRAPADSAEAYVAMVEENEIRVGLSYYERARVTLRAAQAGAYPDTGEALRGLFASASRAKRSKIGSFMTLVEALEGYLAFPAALGERTGLILARALAEDAGLAGRLRDLLAANPPADAAAEQALLLGALKPAPKPKASPAEAGPPKGATELRPGLYLQAAGGSSAPRFTISGPRVDAGFREKLETWLRDQG